MENYCLKWNDFERNIRESFRKRREEQILFDITLASDDGRQIQAHKIVLAAGSDFFSNIFKKSDHTNMLIYLKGISSVDLEHISDFLYNGEASVPHEELEGFLKTSKELQVKGLLGDPQDIGQNGSKTHKLICQDTKQEIDNQIDCKEAILDSFVSRDDTIISSEKNIAIENDNEDLVCSRNDAETILKNNLDINCDNSYDLSIEAETVPDKTLANDYELDLTIDYMVEKNEGVWKCKVCGKTANHRNGQRNIRKHAETHIKGMSHVCQVCNKTYPNRHGLNTHISAIHSKLFCCDVCGKSGMNKKTYQQHCKRKCHAKLPGKLVDVQITPENILAITNDNKPDLTIDPQVERSFLHEANQEIDSKKEILDAIDEKDETVTISETNLNVMNDEEIDLQIDSMVEKQEGIWKCKVCGKMIMMKNRNRKRNIRKHAETHIKGMSHVCQVCDKSFSTRHSLKFHISYIHSDVSSCEACGKTGMNRKTTQEHKWKCRAISSIKS